MQNRISSIFARPAMNFGNMDAKAAASAVLTTACAVAAMSAIWVVYDYNQWVAFGTGGTPPTPSGYVSLPLSHCPFRQRDACLDGVAGLAE